MNNSHNTFADFPAFERAPGPDGATDGELFLEAPLYDGLGGSLRRTGFCCTDDATTGLRGAAAALGTSSVLLGLITLAGRLLVKSMIQQIIKLQD